MPGHPLRIRHHPAFAEEVRALRAADPGEADAIATAIRILEACGGRVGHPHTSGLRGSGRGLRELRPRSGRSRVRVIHVRRGDAIELLALAPDGRSDPRGFERAVARARQRLTTMGN